jgi:hypothetical protein
MAQYLEAGMNIFINRDTLEYTTILDWDVIIDPEPWEEEMEKIENEWSNYVIIKGMESHEAFKIMVEFVDKVEEPRLKEDLIKILNRKSPFANFKAEIECSDYRENWFDYRTKRYEKHLKENLDLMGIEYE